MQYKKEELNTIILEIAEKEFLKNGYQNTSLRQIAKQAGTTIGNLYHYFNSKEALFDELMGQEHTAFLYLLQHHSEIELPDDIVNNNDIHVWRAILADWIEKIMPAFTKRFLIMLEKSGGTRYEGTKSEFLDVLAAHFDEHIREAGMVITPGLTHVIATQILCGILCAIENCDDQQRLKQLICDTLLFNIAGIMRLLEL